MQFRWLKTPVQTLGQLIEFTVYLDGVVFTGGFAVASRRKQDEVFGREPTRIEGSPGQRIPRRLMKPANGCRRRIDSRAKHRWTSGGRDPFWGSLSSASGW
jgi:hypothetical protein